MSLETYEQPGDLYLSRGDEVNPLRPIFTGDVMSDVAIPGVQDGGMALVIAHPCSIRGAGGSLGEAILMAAVVPEGSVGPGAWTRGYYDRTPLPEVVEGRSYSGRLDLIGRATTSDVAGSGRIACASQFGVNLLQQRLVWHLTRLEVPTFQFNEAFAHTYEEADLLEEWNDEVVGAGVTLEESTSLFDAFIRADRGDNRTLQTDLVDPQRRSAVRIACRTEASRLARERDSA